MRKNLTENVNIVLQKKFFHFFLSEIKVILLADVVFSSYTSICGTCQNTSQNYKFYEKICDIGCFNFLPTESNHKTLLVSIISVVFVLITC